MARIIFAGTPAFAAEALRALHAAGHEIVLVLTRPDQPAGRGRALRESEVRQLARTLGLPVAQPRTLRDPAVHGQLRTLQPDIMVVAAYGLIVPPEVLAIPARGCLNIHASLLPRWRGAAPIQRAIEAGDRETGITIMQMDEGLDTGPMLLVVRTPISADDTGATVHDRLAALGAQAIVDALARIEAGELPATAQPEAGVTWAPKLSRADSVIDWAWPAQRIVDRIRAFDPVPGATTTLADEPGTSLKIWKARVFSSGGVSGAPEPAGSIPENGRGDAGPDELPGDSAGATAGQVLDVPGRLVVACGDGAIELLELQKPGGRRLTAHEFLRGFPLAAGRRLGGPPASA